eukprot:scaffold1069_cov155-Amphora_coffeaeformis.AAC.1
MKDTNHGVLSSRGIGHGTENVKTGPDTQLFADRGHESHGGMIDGGKHKGNPDGVDAFLDLGGCQVYLDTQGFQDIGRSTRTRDAAIPGLGHDASSGRRQDDRCRTNVNGIGAIPTGSHNIQ